MELPRSLNTQSLQRYTQANVYRSKMLVTGIVAAVALTVSTISFGQDGKKEEVKPEYTPNWNLPETDKEAAALAAQYKYKELKGKLPIRETGFLIRVPEDWNGRLINDLDFGRAANNPRNLYLLEKGYALSGTLRRSDRLEHYDPAHEIHDLITVLDLFEAKFGKPERTIQYGCSGGGTVANGMSELHPDRIDGAISTNSVTSPWFGASNLDGFFVLKALLAQDLPIVSLPLGGPDMVEVSEKWEKVLGEAQATAEGRARIALAVTIGQWAAWGGTFGADELSPLPEPDPTDAKALQESMYRTVSLLSPSPRTFGHTMLERAARGQMRWNTGVDYREFFNNGDPLYVKAVKTLYKEANLSLKADLKAVNAFPRVAADAHAVKYWSVPGRTHVGEPKVPTLRVHNSGDLLVNPSISQGYKELVEQKGYSALFRNAFINRAGHCTHNLAEFAAALETMNQRLDTGEWPSTEPEAMNKLALSLVPAEESRYFNYRGVKKYNRTWLPTPADFMGKAAN